MNIKCPKCSSGTMREGESSFTCDYFKSLDDKCNFIVWKNQFGIEINESILSDLCENNITDTLLLKNKNGDEYSAKLKLDASTGKIYSWNEIEEIDNEIIKCPKCSSGIKEFSKSFQCANDDCDFVVFKGVADHSLTIADLEMLLQNKQTAFYDLTSKAGKSFTTSFKFDDDFKVVFDNNLCLCPVCKDKMIQSWSNSFTCPECDFIVWKNHNGATNLNYKDVIQLCKTNSTRTLYFVSKDKKQYKGKLVLNDDYKIATIM